MQSNNVALLPRSGLGGGWGRMGWWRKVDAGARGGDGFDAAFAMRIVLVLDHIAGNQSGNGDVREEPATTTPRFSDRGCPLFGFSCAIEMVNQFCSPFFFRFSDRRCNLDALFVAVFFLYLIITSLAAKICIASGTVWNALSAHRILHSLFR
jgi:hypothetical protein